MSLLKSYDLVRKEPAMNNEDIKGAFLDIIATADGNYTQTDVVALLTLYTAISINYIEEVATSLTDNVPLSSTLKFMNSYIAELVHKANLHYYHKEDGYSIVDKPIQFALDNGGLVTTEYVEECISEIEGSYFEEEYEDDSTH